MDTDHPKYFTTRHLIVGVSRATHGQYVHVPTRSQETNLMKTALRKVSSELVAVADEAESGYSIHQEAEQEQEPMSLAMNVTIGIHPHDGERSYTLESVLAPSPICEEPRSFLAGCARLKCEPCGNTLRTSGLVCEYCKRSRGEILATQ